MNGADCNKEEDRKSSELTMAIAITCVVLVAIDLRPAIVSVGPLLPSIRDEFAISNAQASLLTAIPAHGAVRFPDTMACPPLRAR